MSLASMSSKKLRKIPLSKSFILVLLIIGSVLFLLPLYWVLVAAISGGGGTFSVQFYPRRIDLSAFYKLIFKTPFPRWFLNSIIVATSTMLIRLFLCSTAGYAFAKKRFPGSTFLFWLLMSTMMIPAVINIIPMFLIGIKLGIIDTYLGMIVPVASYPFGIFLMRQFMITIPSDIMEAAIIDGCSEIQVFYHAILPMAKPAMGALGILSFTQVWNAFVWQTIMTSSEKMRTLPVGISTLAVGQYTQDWATMLAGVTMAAIPMIAIFLFFQDYFVKGLTTGSVKG
jgi:ABC-type glycerol-3-phosphate transport system permease component